MNPWPDIVVGLWLAYATWEDWKKRVIDVGVPVAIILTRVATEGVGWILPTLSIVVPLYVFMKFMELVPTLLRLFRIKTDIVVWSEGDTYLMTAVALYLGLDFINGLLYIFFSQLIMTEIYIIELARKGKKLEWEELFNEPLPFAPGLFVVYTFSHLAPLYLN